MACGENPKRVYGEKNTAPSTRMGNVAGYRAAWVEAEEYLRDWKDYEAKLKAGGKAAADAKPPKRDLKLDTLARALEGRDPHPDALLPRRRDGDHARHVARVRLPHRRVPPRDRGLQDREPAGRERACARRCGRLVGFKDGEQ